MREIPQWMHPSTTAEDWRRSPLPAAGRARIGATRKAAGAFGRLLADMLSNEQTAAANGLLQRIDARVKIVAMLVLVVTATLLHSLGALATLYVAALVLAGLSRVPLRKLARIWVVAPLFSAAVLVPAALNVVTPGRPVLVLHASDPLVTVTDAGLLVVGRMILRVATCVSLVMLLTATTRSQRLFRALRMLGVPVIFVMLLSMMERYIWVLARSAEEIHLAKLSRSITSGSTREEQAWVAAGMGSLFRRTRKLGNEVYLAMISRGYTGEVHLLK